MHQTHRGRQSYQLPWGRWHTHRGHDFVQMLGKQHHLHTRSMLHHDGYKRFLLEYTDETLGVHAPQRIRHPRGNPIRIQFTWENIQRQIRLLWNKKGHVRLTAGRNHHAGTTGRETGNAWLPSKQNRTRPLDPQNQANQIYAGSRQLRNKGYVWVRCEPHHQCTKKGLHNHSGQRGKQIHWSHHQMGLQQQQSPFTYTRIFSKSNDVLQTQNPNKNPELTSSSRWNKKWSQTTICGWRRRVPPPQQGGDQIRPGSSRHPLVLRKSSWRNDPPHTQLHRNRTGKTDTADNGNNQAAPWLLYHSGGSNHNIEGQQNDFMHPQQRGILQQKKWQKPRRGTLLPIQQRSIPPQQWSHHDHRNHNKSGHGIGGGGRTGSTIWKRKRRSIFTPNPHQKWVIPSHVHQSRRTTWWQKGSSTIKYNPSEWRQWTCVSTGSTIVRHKANFEFIGIRVKQI